MVTLLDLSLQDAEQALAVIDAHDRDVWVEMGMAMKAEFGDGGFDVWDRWSESAANYNPRAALKTWRSFRGGKVGIGSLVKRATDLGFKFNHQPMSAEDKAALRKRQDERRAELERQAQVDEADRLAWHQLVAEACRVLDQQHLSDSGKSDYLRAKKVGSFGLRFVNHGVVIVTHIVDKRIELISGKDEISAFFDKLNSGAIDRERTTFRYVKYGSIAVPLRCPDGHLWAFQFINAQGGKRFLKFARKQGLHHWVNGGNDARAPECIGVAEGYATAASIHMATGWPVAVAFDKGNLLPICRALRGVYPDARLVVCGDDDHGE